jgi:GxxExxY protein
MALKHEEITDAILKAFYKVYNTLGYGFLERVYENALTVELRKQGLKVEQQVPIKVHYEGVVVGEYFADVLVEDKVIVETKSAETLIGEHEAQLLNYLRGTEMEVGLVLNFGPKPEFRRKAYDNARKSALPGNSRHYQR